MTESSEMKEIKAILQNLQSRTRHLLSATNEIQERQRIRELEKSNERKSSMRKRLSDRTIRWKFTSGFDGNFSSQCDYLYKNITY